MNNIVNVLQDNGPVEYLFRINVWRFVAHSRPKKYKAWIRLGPATKGDAVTSQKVT